MLATAALLLTGLLAPVGHAQAVGLHAWLDPAELAMKPTAQVRLVGTTDEKHQGQDYRLLGPAEKATIVTIAGPAIIHRIWSTSQHTDDTRLVVRVDGKEQPLWERAKLPAGQGAGDPLRAVNGQAYINYVPLRVGRKAEFIATDLRPAKGEEKTPVSEDQGNKFYLQVAYTEGDAGAMAPAQVDEVRKSLKIYATDPLAGTADIVVEGGGKQPKVQKLTARIGEYAPVEGDEKTYVKTLVIDTAGAAFDALQATRLVLRSDGSTKPCVDVPVPDLLCLYWGADEYAAPVTASKGGKLVFRLPIPVGKGLEVGLEPGGKGKPVPSLDLTLVKGTAAQPLPYRLCAQYHSEISVRDQPLHLAEVQGEGVFVGCSFAADGMAHRKFSFLEGNEQIYVDGDKEPSWEGTGTEDFFNSAWYFSAGVEAHAFHGLTHLDEGPPPRMSSYRYLVPDRIAFTTGLKVDMQHGSRNSVPETLYKSVCLWYQKPPCEVSAPVEVKDTGSTASPGEETEEAGSTVDVVTPTILAAIILLFVVAGVRALTRRSR